jgi:hypothetical protein
MSPPAEGDPAAPNPPHRPGALYTSSSDGLKAVRDDYLYWTGRLTDTSFQLSLALIAANWAVFGSVKDLLKAPWARASILLVILSLTLNLLGAKRMGELHRRRIDYAAADSERWEKECAAALGRRDPWPITKDIELTGQVLRELRTWLPFAAGIAFAIAVLVR